MTAASPTRMMPKTVRPKEVVIGDKVYDKCPYRGCAHMVEVGKLVDEDTIMRPKKLASPDDIYGRIRQVHGYVWLTKGGRGGWWHISKFHPRPEVEAAN
jgi:hypothetical protein